MPKTLDAPQLDYSNKVETLKPHAVILWNSDVHSVLFVVAVLQEICKMTEKDALLAAKEVHEKGKAAVFHGHKELCELKVEQMQTFRDPLVAANGGPSEPLQLTIAEG